MTQEKTAQVITDLETRVLPEVVADLSRVKATVLAAQRLLPQEYPELGQEGVTPTRPAVLHGDLSILASVLDEAITQARTAVTGASQEVTKTLDGTEINHLDVANPTPEDG